MRCKSRVALIYIFLILIILTSCNRLAVYKTHDDEDNRYFLMDGIKYYQGSSDWYIRNHEVNEHIGYLDTYKHKLYSIQGDDELRFVKVKEKWFACMMNAPYVREDIFHLDLKREDVDKAVWRYIEIVETDDGIDNIIHEKDISAEDLDPLFQYLEGENAYEAFRDRVERHYPKDDYGSIYLYHKNIKCVEGRIDLISMYPYTWARTYTDKIYIVPEDIILLIIDNYKKVLDR